MWVHEVKIGRTEGIKKYRDITKTNFPDFYSLSVQFLKSWTKPRGTPSPENKFLYSK